MMKKVTAFFVVSVILAVLLSACGSEPAAQASAMPDVTGTSARIVYTSPSITTTDYAALTLKDGTYEYVGKKDLEGYHVEGTMVVSGGAIQSMEWKIVDNTGRVFDETYEEVYTGVDLYIQQCRDNWSGMQTYVPGLIDKQDPDKVDAISGATWAYYKFEQAAKTLMEQASH